MIRNIHTAGDQKMAHLYLPVVLTCVLLLEYKYNIKYVF